MYTLTYVHTLTHMRDIDIEKLSVRLSVRLSDYVPVSDENGLTHRHSFYTLR